jgi:hypothetical protein
VRTVPTATAARRARDAVPPGADRTVQRAPRRGRLLQQLYGSVATTWSRLLVASGRSSDYCRDMRSGKTARGLVIAIAAYMASLIGGCSSDEPGSTTWYCGIPKNGVAGSCDCVTTKDHEAYQQDVATCTGNCCIDRVEPQGPSCGCLAGVQDCATYATQLSGRVVKSCPASP